MMWWSLVNNIIIAVTIDIFTAAQQYIKLYYRHAAFQFRYLTSRAGWYAALCDSQCDDSNCSLSKVWLLFTVDVKNVTIHSLNWVKLSCFSECTFWTEDVPVNSFFKFHWIMWDVAKWNDIAWVFAYIMHCLCTTVIMEKKLVLDALEMWILLNHR